MYMPLISVRTTLIDRADVVEYRFVICCGALDGDPMAVVCLCVGGCVDFANESSGFRVINALSFNRQVFHI
jgi:hypothetical protein